MRVSQREQKDLWMEKVMTMALLFPKMFLGDVSGLKKGLWEHPLLAQVTTSCVGTMAIPIPPAGVGIAPIGGIQILQHQTVQF